MEQKKSPPKYIAEFREGGVRVFQEDRSNKNSDNAAFKAIAPKLGCSPDKAITRAHKDMKGRPGSRPFTLEGERDRFRDRFLPRTSS